jgi:alkane 1-monooxygenase
MRKMGLVSFCAFFNPKNKNMLQQLKYLSAYIVPLLVGFGFYAKGAWSYTCLLFLFGLVPLLELFLSPKTENLDESRELQTEKSFFFDLLLYLNLPLLYIFLGWYLYILHTHPLSLWEFIGLAINMGLAGGIMGINVAHELGHRTNQYEQWMSKMLLLPNLYTHFFIEHNRGHHVHIATDEDPASARLNEPVYKFYARSVIGGFLSACR